MNWISSAIESLARQPICGYSLEQSAATEPTALAALALAGWSSLAQALAAAEWLAGLQAADGSLGVRQNAAKPCWPTALAALAWQATGGTPNRFAEQIKKGNNWSLSIYGERRKPSELFGHQTMLSAWPWVEGTHSWIEPTALQVVALKRSELGQHPRVREAVELLIDRQLPGGGCNFGNTTVLGKVLPPYIQSTGMAMLALAGEPDSGGRIQRSLAYLGRAISPRTTPVSLAWGLMGLTAHGRRPAEADAWLEQATVKSAPGRMGPMPSALLLLAALAERCPLLPPDRGKTACSLSS
ncbi:MAG: prenyltransferase/squalene oxidase repeat-containing protein [Thermoguttaceae bacterium]